MDGGKSASTTYLNLTSRVLGAAVRHLPNWWHQFHGSTLLLVATDLTDTLVSFDAGHARHATARTLVSADDCDHGHVEHRALTLATVTPEQLGLPHAATALAVTSA